MKSLSSKDQLSQDSYPYLQLISADFCLINNIHNTYPDYLIASHELKLSPYHKGYIVPVKMLNSLKRLLAQLNLFLGNLPSIAFKLHRPKHKDIHYLCCSKNNLKFPWELKEHQLNSIDFFFNNGGRIAISDAWGMGKTVTSLYIVMSTNFKTTLIICHQALIFHWLYHSKQCKLDVTVMYSDKQLELIDRKHGQVYIISYDIMKLVNTNVLLRINCVVIDQIDQNLSLDLIKKIKQVDSILILGKNCKDEITKWLPVLNKQIQLKQLQDRYFSEKSNIYRFQLQASLYKYYLIQNDQKIFSTPILIKKVYVAHNLKQLNTSKPSQIVQITAIAKIPSAFKYLKFAMSKIHVKTLRIVYRSKKVQKALLNHIYMLEGNNIEIQTLQQIINQATFEDFIVFIELYISQQREWVNQMVYQLYLKCHRIECLLIGCLESEKMLFQPQININQKQIWLSTSSHQDNSIISKKQIVALPKSNTRIIYYDSENPSEVIKIEEESEQEFQDINKVSRQKFSKLNLKVYLAPFRSTLTQQ